VVLLCLHACSSEESKPSKSSASASVMKVWLSTAAPKRTDDMSSSAAESADEKKPKIE